MTQPLYVSLTDIPYRQNDLGHVAYAPANGILRTITRYNYSRLLFNGRSAHVTLATTRGTSIGLPTLSYAVISKPQQNIT